MKMKLNRFFSALSVIILFSLAIVSHPNGVSDKKSRLQASQLVALLPASDGVVTINTQRFFADALPRLLSGNQTLMADLIAKLDRMQEKSGIDLRRFEYAAVGVSIRKISDNEIDVEPVIVARGNIASEEVFAAAKAAANGKYREERFDGKVIYLFSAKDLAAQNRPAIGDAKTAGMIDNVINKLASEVAVSSVGPNTIVFGYPDRVRETIEAKSRVGTDLTELLNRKPISVVNMAARVPEGLGVFLPLNDDDLGNTLNSVRFLFGNLDIAGDRLSMNVTARTQQNGQAQQLLETLDGLRAFGGMLLGSSKRPDQQMYARLLNGAKFTRNGNEVTLDMKIPQSDVDALVGALSK
jgi:hypothetical protein